MNNVPYRLRTLESAQDFSALKDFYDTVFTDEPVGQLASVLGQYFPDCENRYWFIVEHEPSQTIAAALVLIPRIWQWQGLELKVAEQGIVATSPSHRGQNLQGLLNQAFDQAVQDGHFDLAIIQGIPGYYQRYGYHYALPLENHVNVHWHVIDQLPPGHTDPLTFRTATTDDIPFLIQQDDHLERVYDVCTKRNKDHWHYLLKHSQHTDTVSKFWIGERQNSPAAYLRLPFNGFGEGQILSEVSHQLCIEDQVDLLKFAQSRGQLRSLPYLRLDLSHHCPLVKLVAGHGVNLGNSYGWQMKIPNMANWITKLTPILEKRLADGGINFTGLFRINCYGPSVDLHWHQGKLTKISQGDLSSIENADYGVDVPRDQLTPLLCGGYDWRTLRTTRPDLYPINGTSEVLLDALFPPLKSWHYSPY